MNVHMFMTTCVNSKSQTLFLDSYQPAPAGSRPRSAAVLVHIGSRTPIPTTLPDTVGVCLMPSYLLLLRRVEGTFFEKERRFVESRSKCRGNVLVRLTTCCLAVCSPRPPLPLHGLVGWFGGLARVGFE